MLATVWKRFRRWAMIGSLAALAAVGVARGQEGNNKEVEELTSRFEAQQQQLLRLQQQLEARQKAIAETKSESAPDAASQDEKIRKLAESVFREKEERKRIEAEEKKCAEESQGYVVGTALGMTARWNPDRGPTFTTANDDFSLHIGGRFQQDEVWWNQAAQLRKPPAAGGMGPLEDGTFFRRVRLQMDGTFWENGIFNMEYSFENFGNNVGTGAMEEFYAGMKNLPWLGEVRIGQVRVPQGLDPGFTASNKAGTFMEPAAMCDAFFNNLGVGVWVGNHVLCDRVVYAMMAYRQEGGSISSGSSLQQGATNGASIGDGDFAYTARLVGIPLYLYDGREILHLGGSATYKCALPNSITAPSSPTFVDFSARPELRDTIGNYNNVGPGNSTRFVSTGPLQCQDVTVLDAELLWIHGPFSIQSEWAEAYAAGAVGQAKTPQAGKNLGNVSFNGGYIQASYILTGESRRYDREHARLDNPYLEPYTPFFLVRNGSGSICSGLGAWEIAARFSYLNLDDGDVQGGIMASETIGLNWYLNTHLKIQFDYLHTLRYDLGASAIIGGVGYLPGYVNGFGIRTQIVF